MNNIRLVAEGFQAMASSLVPPKNKGNVEISGGAWTLVTRNMIPFIVRTS